MNSKINCFGYSIFCFFFYKNVRLWFVKIEIGEKHDDHGKKSLHKTLYLQSDDDDDDDNNNDDDDTTFSRNSWHNIVCI
jgi:hypothetical protein